MYCSGEINSFLEKPSVLPILSDETLDISGHAATRLSSSQAGVTSAARAGSR